MDQETNPHSELVKSLVKAQAEFKAPPKTKKVDFTDKSGRKVKYSYADLADVIDATKDILAKNSLAITQELKTDEAGKFGLCTSLRHTSGAFIKSWHPLPEPGSIRPQDFGSCLTYARRYSLSSLLGISSDEDADGATEHDVVKKPVAVATPRSQATASAPTARKSGPTEPMIGRLFGIAKGSGWPAKYARALSRGITGRGVSELNRQMYDQVCEYLKNNRFDEVQQSMYADHLDVKPAPKADLGTAKGGELEAPWPESEFGPSINQDDEIPF